jgi:hypothetical protein
LVSEKYQFGGTLDTVAHIRNGLGLVDFKTSRTARSIPITSGSSPPMACSGKKTDRTKSSQSGLSPDHLAEGRLEAGPSGISRADLEPFREQFKLLQENMGPRQGHCTSAKALKGIAVTPSIAPERPAKTVRKAAGAR